MVDVFGAGELRASVLRAWAESPTRFREDSNAEEDYARRYYTNRIIIELAQNASDAALSSGREGEHPQSGRLQFRLREESRGWVLSAANTGRPLDATGVASLASLRASSKSAPAGSTSERGADVAAAPATVGRFGVGFAAVRSVADQIEVRSVTGSIRFDADLARSELEALGAGGTVPDAAKALADGRALPVLRLPYPTSAEPAVGFDTEVVLFLRKDAASAVAAQLAAVDDLLLLALPGLVSIDCEYPRHLLDPSSEGAAGEGAGDVGAVAWRVENVHDRWQTVAREGTFIGDELAGLPHEDQGQVRWSVRWAWPLAKGVARTSWPVHAPTPTDELSTMPAVLIGSFPLDPTRRTIAPGPATDRLLHEAAVAYGDLAEAADAQWWRLVPTGAVASVFDARLRTMVLDELQDRRFLPRASEAQRPRDALAASAELVGRPGLLDLALDLMPELVGVESTARQAATALGLPEVGVPEVMTAAAARARGGEPDVLTRLYDGLIGIGRDELSEIPVLLADGRVVEGARGILAPGESPPAIMARLAQWGLRLADPISSHPVVIAAGATSLTALGLLESDALAQATMARLEALLETDAPWLDDDSWLDGEPSDADTDSWVQALPDEMSEDRRLYEVTETILALAATLGSGLGDDLSAISHSDSSDRLAWLGELPLPDDSGDPAPAASLAFRGSVASRLFDKEDVALVSDEVVAAVGQEPLALLGVRRSLSRRIVEGVVLGSEGAPAWEGGSGPSGKDASMPEAWPEYVDYLQGIAEDGAYLGAQTILQDIDLVPEDSFALLLDEIRSDRENYLAVVEPVELAGAGGHNRVPSFAAWWLRRQVSWSVHGLSFFVMADADVLLQRLAPPAPAWLDELSASDSRLATTIGGVRHCAELDASGWGQLLGRVANDSALTTGQVTALWQELVANVEDLDEISLPPLVVALGSSGDPEVVEPGADLVICGEPQWLARLGAAPFIPVAGRENAELLADVLDATPAHLDPGGNRWPERAVCSCDAVTMATLDSVRDLLNDAPSAWESHDDLAIDGFDVDWWVSGTGTEATVQAATIAGAAWGLAWASGRWELRAQVLELLEAPSSFLPIIEEAFTSRPDLVRP